MVHRTDLKQNVWNGSVNDSSAHRHDGGLELLHQLQQSERMRLAQRTFGSTLMYTSRVSGCSSYAKPAASPPSNALVTHGGQAKFLTSAQHKVLGTVSHFERFHSSFHGSAAAAPAAVYHRSSVHVDTVASTYRYR